MEKVIVLNIVSSYLVISCWKPHASSKSQKPDRDFKKLNKIGVKSGALTAKVGKIFTYIYEENEW